ncbi:MAG: hypothetical protein ABJP70_11950 [Erythrobacter sp.]|uniref:hypothetical protein n=1 Tax=Parasphingorhabdus sp. TaxID=2709688 RepID=UPI0032847B09
MVEYALIALFALVTITTGLALVDCWLRGKHAFLTIARERSLLNAGFVPVVKAKETRLRGRALRTGQSRRLPERRAMRPRSEPVPALFAA